MALFPSNVTVYGSVFIIPKTEQVFIAALHLLEAPLRQEEGPSYRLRGAHGSFGRQKKRRLWG
jgi:hypothetical protein